MLWDLLFLPTSSWSAILARFIAIISIHFLSASAILFIVFTLAGQNQLWQQELLFVLIRFQLVQLPIPRLAQKLPFRIRHANIVIVVSVHRVQCCPHHDDDNLPCHLTIDTRQCKERLRSNISKGTRITTTNIVVG